MPEDRRDELTASGKGMYLLQGRPTRKAGPRVQLLGCGTILREVDRRPPSCWRPTSAWPPTSGARTSFTELRRDGQDVERWNLLHPAEPQRIS